MALIEFGLARHRKICLERIETALKLAAAELDAIRRVRMIVAHAAVHGKEVDLDDEIRDADIRASGYLAIAGENVMVGLGKTPSIFDFRPYRPPLDPNDPNIGSFFHVFGVHHFGAPDAAPEPDDVPETRVFALDENFELRGLFASAPEGEALDLYEGWRFIPAAAPLDADEREWLARAVWGYGCSVPDDEIPDDETLIHHARLAADRRHRLADATERFAP